ncbi:MAG: hypothetical protein COB08_008735 [Rhodobacteraceae bacterium]|nr:hypothetical protein [Paracoccaceae bacterium]
MRILFTIFVLFISTVAAQAQNRWMTIENTSNETMTEFYASNDGQNSWGRDWLGRNVLYGGQTIELNFDDGSGYCSWDMKAIFSDGSEAVWNQVDVCVESTWFVFPPVVQSDNRWMTIENTSNDTMTEFYASNDGQSSWGRDWLGRNVLYGGQNIELNFDDGSGYCTWDMKAIFSDGAEVLWNEVDVCVESTWSVSPPVVQADNRWMTIENTSSETMTEFYASNDGQNSWGRDWLGRNVLYGGQNIELNFDDGSGYCSWDMKAIFSDGSEVLWNRVDVCVESAWFVSPPVAQSDNHWMTIENLSGDTMTEFYASNEHQTSWGRDWLGSDVLYNGQNLSFDFSDGSGNCIWDLRATFAGGSEANWTQVNVCVESNWSIR